MPSNGNGPISPDRQIGQYGHLQTLGEGNFAKVYLGRHVILDIEAAIKVLHASIVYEQAEQFENEARIIASLRHPNIVRVLDFDVEDDTPFLVMEYAPQGNLRQQHPAGTLLPLETVVSYVKQVARALQYAHDRGVIHRDIKPENLLVGPRGEVLVTDFGIAVGHLGLDAQATHAAAGTLLYIAPEQINGQPCPASDQYSLAVVVYEWLSGRPPFIGDGEDIVQQHLTADPPSLRARTPAISPAVELVVMKALSKDPQRRYPNISRFAAALEKASKQISTPSGTPGSASTKRPPSRQLSPFAVCLLLTLLLTILGSMGGIVTTLAYQATVTITPVSKNVTQTYALSAVRGTARPTEHQVYARAISATAPPLSETVNATGVGETPGLHAKGALTFYNGLIIAQTVGAGTVLANADGIQVVTDVTAVLPPADPPVFGSVTVSAHALEAGTNGNIAADSINGPCCVSDKSITVRNLSAFSGGQDPQPYTFVRQADVTSVVDAVDSASRRTAQALLQHQVRPNEMLVSPTQCSRKVYSDPAINEQATRVRVTITVNCAGWVFDKEKAISVTDVLFEVNTLRSLGSGYEPLGKAMTIFLLTTLKDAKRGIISLLIEVEGVWIYQFSSPQKRALARLIAGRRPGDAVALLLKQRGVLKVDIQTPWWVNPFIRDRLPSYADHIILNVARVLAPVSNLQNPKH